MRRPIQKPTKAGMYIKLELLKKNLLAKDLAEKMGVSRATISDVIYGKNKCSKTIDRIIDEIAQWK